MTPKGLRRFLNGEQQCAWLEGNVELTDADEREESLELRFKYSGRLEKLMRKPQAAEVLDILRVYAETCIPIPRQTERYYWSVSCLPSTDKTLARVNASWMELFALQPDADGLLAPDYCQWPLSPRAYGRRGCSNGSPDRRSCRGSCGSG